MRRILASVVDVPSQHGGYSMTNRHQERAQQVVTSFKELLDEPALQAISDAQF